jgi:dTDP-4-dehydrorhamnose 3,5-epimerase
LETYKRTDFVAAGIAETFIQDNLSVSQKNALRGLHYQLAPKAQGKLVGVSQGRVFDVAVDIRPGSESFAQWMGVELSAYGGEMLYIPPGFAHGFVAIEDDTTFFYKCTAEYSSELDRGIRWNDPDIAISWPIETPLLSDKDAALPFLKDADI